MIRKALALIDGGSLTMSELALEMDMTEADLKSRLEMMVMMGHLEAIKLTVEDGDPEERCPGCLMAGSCRTDDCSDGPPVVGYRLTDKARRLLGKEGWD